MRISTNTIYERGVAAVERQEKALVRTQEQIASGTRILAASDDPVAATRALAVAEADAANRQYAINCDSAGGALALEDGVLESVSNALQQARTLVVSAGNGALANADRAALAAELRSNLDQVLALANSTDGAGRYLFSGYQDTRQPFIREANGITYAGDDGQRLLQIGGARQIAASDSGRDVFERIRTGNGVFAARADAGNRGTGLIGQGSVVNASALTGHDYTIRFAVAGGVTTYSIVDATAGTTLSAGNPYSAGDAIAFDGVQLEIRGAPSDADEFTVSPSANQSVFKTLTELADALAVPANDAAARTRLTNALGAGLSNLDRALDRVLTMRAAVGSRMQEVDALKGLSEDFSLQYEKALSLLQDVDYAAAISDFTRQQAYLEAAQKSFVKVASLSLFEFL
jgi:flagellar hook-associated protein 3 FlgL